MIQDKRFVFLPGLPVLYPVVWLSDYLGQPFSRWVWLSVTYALTLLWVWGLFALSRRTRLVFWIAIVVSAILAWFNVRYLMSLG